MRSATLSEEMREFAAAGLESDAERAQEASEAWLVFLSGRVSRPAVRLERERAALLLAGTASSPRRGGRSRVPSVLRPPVTSDTC